jgi:hypothetical protein
VARFSSEQGNSGNVFALASALAGLLIQARFKVASFTSFVERVISPLCVIWPAQKKKQGICT